MKNETIDWLIENFLATAVLFLLICYVNVISFSSLDRFPSLMSSGRSKPFVYVDPHLEKEKCRSSSTTSLERKWKQKTKKRKAKSIMCANRTIDSKLRERHECEHVLFICRLSLFKWDDWTIERRPKSMLIIGLDVTKWTRKRPNHPVKQQWATRVATN